MGLGENTLGWNKIITWKFILKIQIQCIFQYKNLDDVDIHFFFHV
jgi:hypothetical protein